MRSTPFRVFTAVLFGMAGFAGNLLDIRLIQSPSLEVSILGGLLFPLVISLAWGWRFGLISALAGGCQSMWWLWRTDGWGVIYAVPVFTLWVVWHGWWADRRARANDRHPWYLSAFSVEVPFRLASELGFYTAFRWLVSLNPPPWNPAFLWDHVPLSWVHTVAAKHAVTSYVLLLMAYAILSLGPARRLFGLRPRPAQRDANILYALALLMGLLIWAADSAVRFVLFNEEGRRFWDIAVLDVEPRVLIVRTLYILIPVVAAVVIARAASRRALLQERLEHINRILAAIRNVNQRIVQENDPLALSRGACEDLTETLGYFGAWIALVDEEGRGVTLTAGSGLGNRYPVLCEHLDRRAFPACMKRALAEDGIVLVRDPKRECPACPLSPQSDGRAALARRLVYQGRVFGVLAVYVPSALGADEEEQALFDEVAGDLAFAFQRMEDTEALRREHELTQRLLDTSPAGIVLVDRTGLIGYANRQAETVLGLHPSAIIGRSYDDPAWRITDGEGMPFPEDRLPFQVVRKTRLPVFGVEHAVEWADGRRVLLSINAAPLLDEGGAFQGMVTALEDVTEQRRAEKALQESEERYRSLFKGIPVGLYRVDSRGRIAEANPALVRMLGYESRDDLAEVEVPGLFVRPEAYQVQRRLLDRDGELLGFETELRRPDGTTLWVKDSARIVRTPDGETFTEGSLEEITERKEAEAERRHMEVQLQQAQKMEAIGTLAGGIAHDFNNILGAILGNTEMAIMDLPAGHPARESLDEVRQASLRARDLVRQILVVARKQEMRLVPMSMGPVVTDSLKMLRSALPATVEIQVRIAADLPPLLADPSQIQQVVMNLCTNAAQEMEEGGGTLCVALDEENVDEGRGLTAGGLRPGRYLRLRVSDTGSGIVPEAEKRLFEPYFTTKEVGRGTGLGLAVVHGIVKERGGGIDVESEQGKGASFTVYLPASDAASADPGEPVEASAPPGGNERILLVDDEPAILRLGERILERLGYEVEARSSGPEALSCLQEDPGRFDLVVTDMTMPRMTGDAFAAQVHRIRPDLPVILCSGHPRRVAGETDRETGIRASLMKPLSQRDMARVVRDVLDGKEDAEGLHPPLP